MQLQFQRRAFSSRSVSARPRRRSSSAPREKRTKVRRYPMAERIWVRRVERRSDLGVERVSEKGYGGVATCEKRRLRRRRREGWLVRWAGRAVDLVVGTKGGQSACERRASAELTFIKDKHVILLPPLATSLWTLAAPSTRLQPTSITTVRRASPPLASRLHCLFLLLMSSPSSAHESSSFRSKPSPDIGEGREDKGGGRGRVCLLALLCRGGSC